MSRKRITCEIQRLISEARNLVALGLNVLVVTDCLTDQEAQEPLGEIRGGRRKPQGQAGTRHKRINPHLQKTSLAHRLPSTQFTKSEHGIHPYENTTPLQQLPHHTMKKIPNEHQSTLKTQPSQQKETGDTIHSTNLKHQNMTDIWGYSQSTHNSQSLQE